MLKNNRDHDRHHERRDARLEGIQRFRTHKTNGISPKSKEIVLSLKKIQDPFHPEIEVAFDEFVNHVGSAKKEDVDLSEVGLLLAGVTKIYTSQVDTLVSDVQNLLASVTRVKKLSIERKRTKKNESLLENGDDKTTAVETHNNIDEMVEEKVDKDEENDSPSEHMVEEATSTELESLPENHNLVNENMAILESKTNDPEPDVPIVPEATVPEENGISGSTSDCVSPDQIINEIPGPNTRKRSQLLNSILELDENGQPLKKKPRNFFKSLPTLISCYEELENLRQNGFLNSHTDYDNSLPPILEMAHRLTRNRNLLYTEDKISLKNPKDDFIIRHRDILNPPFISNSSLTSENAMNSEIDNPSDDLSLEGTTPIPQSSTETTVENGGQIPLVLSAAANATNFSPEDQAAIQECINELHYLPFTFELSKSDLSAAFSKTVERMSRIFQKNNVQVTRNVVKEASVITSGTVESPNKSTGSILFPPAGHSLGEIYNTFVKTCREECELFITNEKTIMERHKEKSFAESRANIRSMIAELQRNIVPKFARVPLMAENTPEFFQHVTNFEKKMKRILEEEAKKDEFDVRKYEREVLEVTAKESSEMDRLSEDFLIPCSPLKLHSDMDLSEAIHASPSTRSSFDGSQSSCGSSWVPLKHIFQHMKSIDRTEAARLFYAVLALLSYQNLDINYEQLYSVESAALIHKQLTGLSKEEEMDSRFPRGVKIVTSRCPDVDKEEVFVAALTAESRDEAFRHLLEQEGGGGPGTSKTSTMNGHIDDGIRELMSDFVEESGAIFSGRLEARRRNKKPENS